MGFFKKLFGTAAVTGAAVGGALYVKKRKDEKEMNKDFFEDFDDSKAFEIQKDDNTDGTTKVTLTINKRKVKNMADIAADKVIDASDKLKDTVSEKIGEEKMEAVKDKIDTAKEKVSDVADMAKEKFYDAKDVVVETVGEDKIDAAKEKVSEVANMAKDKVSETINKVTTPSKETEDFEDDLFEEDLDDDFLEDELKDI
ncbi:MAG: hypothetical protein HFG29_02530 [Eubacterium sp.]|nr:hypothetical protein [Eubacterium sp.]